LKITREELSHSTEEQSLDLFLQGIKAEATKKKYTRTLRKIVCEIFEDILEGNFEERANQLVKFSKENPKWATNLVLNLSKKVKERTKLPKDHSNYLNPSSFDSYFKPIKKLFDMNDVTISWKRVYATFPEIDNLSTGRGWTRQEIQRMLNFANGAIDRLIILIAASSGIRSGGFDLDWEDITPIFKVGDELKMEITESESEQVACAMLRIYKGSSWQYPAFITSEAYSALQDYKSEWIREIGREPKPTEPIFKIEGSLPRRASSASIKKRVERMTQKAGLRKPLPKGQRRYDVPIMNGFRRFWNKTCKESLSRDSPLASLIKKEYMMGHSGLVKLDRNYFKTHTIELAEEYMTTVADLTISDEFRLRTDNIRLRSERDRYADSDLIKDLQKRIYNIEKGRTIRTGNFTKYLLSEKDNVKKELTSLWYYLFEAIHPEEVKQSCWEKLYKLNEEGKPLTKEFLDNELAEEQKIGVANLIKIFSQK